MVIALGHGIIGLCLLHRPLISNGTRFACSSSTTIPR